MVAADYIFERELTTQRPAGGKIDTARIIQLENGEWFVTVRVNWRSAAEFSVYLFDKKKLKTYLRLSNAVRHIVMDYDYDEPMIIIPHPTLREKNNF